MAKAILFISTRERLQDYLDRQFLAHYKPYHLTPAELPELPGRETPIQLLVISGYSLQEARREIPTLDDILAPLPARLPRLYLLLEADPSLSLVPLKGENRFFYLRGPLSARSLRSAIDQILALKPRAPRRRLPPEQDITARFTLKTRQATPIVWTRRVLDISATGFSFPWAPDAPLIYPGDVLEHLELCCHGQPFIRSRAQIRQLTLLPPEAGGGMRVGAELVDARLLTPEGTIARGGSFLGDPVVIQTVLSDAVERETLVLIRGEQPGWELEVVATGQAIG